jgi:hypothetical protein
LTAGENAVVFTASTISGTDEYGEPAAATLAFGVKDSTLAINADTTIAALTLDVSAAGKITVAANQKLTLKYVAGEAEDGVLSGAIFTKKVTTGSGNVVKANAATPKSSDGAIDDAAALATVKVAVGTVTDTGDLGTGAANKALADGVIGSASAVTINKSNTFTVGDAGAITVGT